MKPLQQAEALVAKMTRGEKAQLLQHLARDLGDAFPGIDLTDGVAGGDPCIAPTRIAIWTLEQARRTGASEAELLRSYPVLQAEDLAQRVGICPRASRPDRRPDSRERSSLAAQPYLVAPAASFCGSAWTRQGSARMRSPLRALDPSSALPWPCA